MTKKCNHFKSLSHIWHRNKLARARIPIMWLKFHKSLTIILARSKRWLRSKISSINTMHLLNKYLRRWRLKYSSLSKRLAKNRKTTQIYHREADIAKVSVNVMFTRVCSKFVERWWLNRDEGAVTKVSFQFISKC